MEGSGVIGVRIPLHLAKGKLGGLKSELQHLIA